MFKVLSNKILRSIRNIIQTKYLTEKSIENILNELRISLLEGDVALPVVCDFINQVQKSVIKRNLNKYLTPGEEFIKIIFISLSKTIGKGIIDLNLNIQTPTTILVVGLQGSGKTTTVGKLANFLYRKKDKKVLVSSTDIYRPAGLDQLKTLICVEKNINFFSDYNVTSDRPIDIAKKALILSKLQHYDVLLIDTVGCADTDYRLLSELTEIHEIIHPIETLFVVDAMMGQIVTDSVKIFNEAVPLTGIILTKLDGDARAGAALSIAYIVNKPIKFMGIGEKINDFEPFYPDRIASRILGMGDMNSLVEDITSRSIFKIQKKRIEKYSTEFNLYDFLNHIKQIRQIGGINKIISKLPNFGTNTDNLELVFSDEKLLCIESIINSMTIEERVNPIIITDSRKKRIAAGSGVNVQDVISLLDKFNKIRVMVQHMNKNSVFKMLNMLKNKVSSKFYVL